MISIFPFSPAVFNPYCQFCHQHRWLTPFPLSAGTILRVTSIPGQQQCHLIPGNYQIDLFEDMQEMIKLYQAIDGVKNRFGES